VWVSRREIFWLLVVPLGCAVGAAVGAAFDVARAEGSAAMLVAVSGVVGLLVIPATVALTRNGAAKKPPGRRWWFGPLLGLGIGVTSAASAVGHTAEGCMLALLAGVLFSFAALIANRIRRHAVSQVSGVG
jgi:drug/metabolite transporter (DMT)-like permease